MWVLKVGKEGEDLRPMTEEERKYFEEFPDLLVWEKDLVAHKVEDLNRVKENPLYQEYLNNIIRPLLAVFLGKFGLKFIRMVEE